MGDKTWVPEDETKAFSKSKRRGKVDGKAEEKTENCTFVFCHLCRERLCKFIEMDGFKKKFISLVKKKEASCLDQENITIEELRPVRYDIFQDKYNWSFGIRLPGEGEEAPDSLNKIYKHADSQLHKNALEAIAAAEVLKSAAANAVANEMEKLSINSLSGQIGLALLVTSRAIQSFVP